MKSKTILFASTALALLAGVQQADAGRFYAGVMGGGNWQKDPDASFRSGPTFFGGTRSTTVNADVESGYVLGASVGAHLDDFVPGLRAEIEGSYRHNKINGHFSTTGSGHTVPFGATFPAHSSGRIDGNVTTWAVMANAWYDFQVGGKFVPYIGGGAGWADTKDEGNFVSTIGPGSTHFKTDASGFAWQLGAGINYPITDDVKLGLGYRYFRTPDVDPVFFGKHNTPTDFRQDNHSVALTLTVDVD